MIFEILTLNSPKILAYLLLPFQIYLNWNRLLYGKQFNNTNTTDYINYSH